MKALAALGVLALSAASPAAAMEGCSCVALGRVYQQGQTACFSLPTGQRYARCDRVLNNSSWTILGELCPPADTVDPAASQTSDADKGTQGPEGAIYSICLDRDPRG